MSVHVPGRRDDVNPRPDLGFPVKQLIARSGEVDELRNGVLGGARGLQLTPLAEDGPTREGRVSANVVEVQVAVDDQVDVLHRHPRRTKGLFDLDPSRPVPVLGLLVRFPQARVEEENAIRRPDHVPEHRLDPGTGRAGLLWRADEGSQLDPHDVIHTHDPTLGRGECRQSLSRAIAWAKPLSTSRSRWVSRPNNTSCVAESCYNGRINELIAAWA